MSMNICLYKHAIYKINTVIRVQTNTKTKGQNVHDYEDNYTYYAMCITTLIVVTNIN